MDNFECKSVCILGRQPELGLAELESLYGSEHIKHINNCALLDIDVEHINFKRLGGTLKLAKVLAILPQVSWSTIEEYLAEKIPEHLSYVPEGKFTLGLSTYGLGLNAKVINQTGLRLKRIIKQTGRPVRIVPNKLEVLNTAQVLHNRLTTRGGWELLLIRHSKMTILAQSIFVQDIESYAARDQTRPFRDSKVGMIPPKLAQIMINLANPPENTVILDPFCGSGVILQEALIMGYKVIGSDLNPQMVEYAKKNLNWLGQKYEIPQTDYQVELGDATTHDWNKQFDCVASEIYLGKPLLGLPPPVELQKIIDEIDQLLKDFLINLSTKIKPATRVSLAVPAWHKDTFFYHLPVLDQIKHLGYNRSSFVHAMASDLIYHRPNQIVARELIVLTRI